MKSKGKPFAALVVFFLSASLTLADSPAPIQVNWDSRTAGCPASVTQSTNLTFHVTNINDLLIDFQTGERVQFEFRAKSWPVSVVPSENPFLQIGAQAACPSDTDLAKQLDDIRKIKDSNITPSSSAAASISLAATANAAATHNEIVTVANEYQNKACADGVFAAHANDAVVIWIKDLLAAPPHSADFSVTVNPNENYEFRVRELWKGKVVADGTLTWECGEKDILTLSAGPLITTLPYRTYSQQQVALTGGGTQNQLVVSGNSNVNVLAAALLNYNLPPIPHLPPWTGFAISVGPVYALNSAPSVSKLGLFVGGSFQVYKSIYLTPGVHIGEFSDYPAGFHAGSPIPANFGSLTPVTRNTVHFAIGITFKTTTFKKSSQNNAGANNTGATTNSGTGSKPKPAQQSSGSQGTGTPSPNPPPARNQNQ
jgi:hypothetical protein